MLKAKPIKNVDQPASPAISFGTVTGRLLIILVIAALAVALWQLSDIVVLLFGSILLAIGLCAATRLVARHTGINRSVALAGVFLLGLGVFGAALWVFGATVAGQLNDVIQAASAGSKLVMAWLTGNPYETQALEQMRGANGVGATGWATSMVTTVGSLITCGLAYAVIALFVAIYLAAQPDRYVHLCLRLVPPTQRPIAEALIGVTGRVLERWLAGQLIVMMTTGVLSGIGLQLMGIEAPSHSG